MPAVEYRIRPANPGAHLFEVTCTVAEPDPAGQVFSLPAWIPGSYMIREFARNIVSLSAPGRWRTLRSGEARQAHLARRGRVRGAHSDVHYQVYAWDLSVRTAHLDTTHGFFNGTSVFLAVAGRRDAPCVVTIEKPEGEPVATGSLSPRCRPSTGGRAMPTASAASVRRTTTS